jgi:hypothetical protein
MVAFRHLSNAPNEQGKYLVTFTVYDSPVPLSKLHIFKLTFPQPVYHPSADRLATQNDCTCVSINTAERATCMVHAMYATASDKTFSAVLAKIKISNIEQWRT